MSLFFHSYYLIYLECLYPACVYPACLYPACLYSAWKSFCPSSADWSELLKGPPVLHPLIKLFLLYKPLCMVYQLFSVCWSMPGEHKLLRSKNHDFFMFATLTFSSEPHGWAGLKHLMNKWMHSWIDYTYIHESIQQFQRLQYSLLYIILYRLYISHTT